MDQSCGRSLASPPAVGSQGGSVPRSQSGLAPAGSAGRAGTQPGGVSWVVTAGIQGSQGSQGSHACFPMAGAGMWLCGLVARAQGHALVSPGLLKRLWDLLFLLLQAGILELGYLNPWDVHDCPIHGVHCPSPWSAGTAPQEPSLDNSQKTHQAGALGLPSPLTAAVTGRTWI